ncbi:MAG: hypothetical protein KF873_17685 [Gemmataceae bacterium]|nr:hypothetical protein [Gemmataceae bacterium]
MTDLGRTALEAWLRLVVDATGPTPNTSDEESSPVDARDRTEAALRRELDLHRAAWSEPDDPPALQRMVDAIALVWLQRDYLCLRTAVVVVQGPPEVVARYRKMADDADREVARLLCDLERARSARIEREASQLRLEELRRAARRMRKNPNRRPKRARDDDNPLARRTTDNPEDDEALAIFFGTESSESSESSDSTQAAETPPHKPKMSKRELDESLAQFLGYRLVPRRNRRPADG